MQKAATPTNRTTPTSKVVDYLDNSDEAFEEWYQKHVMDKI